MARCPCCKQVLQRYPRNAGKPWSAKADETLKRAALRMRKNGATVEVAVQRLSPMFGRTHHSIYARLAKLDLITL